MAEENPGLIGSIRRLASTLVSIVATRLELLGNELQEERLRLSQMLLYFFVAIICFAMAALLLTIFVVALFWDDHRLAVLAGLSVFFILAGSLSTLALRGLAARRSPLFSCSLAELAKDKVQLDAGHE
ncbi:MAG: phage holin family protein [Gallionella sp.]